MRAIVHETISGEPVTEMPFSSTSWSSGICRSDSVSVTVPGYTGLNLYQFMVPKKFTLTLVEDDGRVRGAGPLGIPEGSTDKDGLHKVSLEGRGIESIFERRSVLPYPYWPLVDSGGFPLSSKNTRITGVEYGTMMQMLYQQAVSHPGAGLPISWEAPRAGTREKEWSAVDGKPVQDAVDDISQLIGGVEWDWVPTVDENDRLTWAFVTATDADQELSSEFVHTWQSGGSLPDIADLTVKVSPEFMVSTAVFTGGKDEDRVMVARSMSDTLINAGVPPIDVWDSSHSSVSDQATLNQWASKRIDEGQAPVQYWGFKVRADRALGLRHGDWATVEVSDHWLIPDGPYPRRVVEVSGTHENEWLSVVVAGELSW